MAQVLLQSLDGFLTDLGGIVSLLLLLCHLLVFLKSHGNWLSGKEIRPIRLTEFRLAELLDTRLQALL